MKDVSNKTIVSLLVVALIITIAGTIVSVDKLSWVGDKYSQLTGAVAGTGTTELTLSGTLSIKIQDGNLSFGSGYYNASCPGGNAYATFTTNGTSVAAGVKQGTNITYVCWLNTSGVQPLNTPYDAHHIENNGTTAINLTLTASGASAEEFLCEGICGSNVAAVYTKFSQQEGITCSGGANQSWVNVLSSGANTSATYDLCTTMEFGDANDEILVDFNITLPSDAPSGLKILTVTYTATEKT